MEALSTTYTLFNGFTYNTRGYFVSWIISQSLGGSVRPFCCSAFRPYFARFYSVRAYFARSRDLIW